MKKSLIFLLLLAICFNPLFCQNTPTADFAFSHVTILDVESGELIPQQTVFIKDDKIVAIIPTDQAGIGRTTQIQVADGQILIPGLAEMHAHIPGNQNMKLLEETLFLYLSNGVTTIRGMLGQPFHLELKEKVRSGEILGPRIYTSGPSLNGNSVTSVEQAEQTVRDQKAAGYDFMKLHPGLTSENFNAIVETAKEVNMPFAGHVSIDVGVRKALASKYASIDHVDGYVEGLVPKEAGIDPNANGFFGINFTDLADESKIDELVKMKVENDVWIVPTQAMMERWVGPQEPELIAQDPEMKYMPPYTLNAWVRTKGQVIGAPDYDPDQALRFNELRRKFIKELHDGGANFILGSDAPQVFNVPGFSIQRELEAMTRSGFTPLEAIQAGTLNPAKFFQQEGEFGVIKEGASADLILLYGNPFEDINNMRKQVGVMVRGKWMTQAEIETRLNEIANSYGN